MRCCESYCESITNCFLTPLSQIKYDQVQRKNRIVAKVRCKNLKNECPKPSCDDPVLLPERCCKTCPGEEGSIKLATSFYVLN